MTSALAQPPVITAPIKSRQDRLRVLPVPDAEPPFDDERSASRRIRTLPPVRPALRAVTAIAVADNDDGKIAAPPPRSIAAGLGRALVEVITGSRSLHQLRNHCGPAAFSMLMDSAAPAGTLPIRLQSTHVSEPSPGVAEVATIFRRGSRVRAIAFRMAVTGERWQVTHLQIG